MIYKANVNKKYPFKQMRPGDTFKLNAEEVRDAQKAAYYYRVTCKRPVLIMIVKRADGYYCQRAE